MTDENINVNNVNDVDEVEEIGEIGETEEIGEIKSPIKAIRAFCIDCMGGQVREVKYCTAPKCPLFAFRMGKNPYMKREMTEEQKAAFVERLKNAKKN